MNKRLVPSPHKSYYEKRGSDTVCIDDEIPFEIPASWEWTRVKDIAISDQYGIRESAKDKGRYKLLRITDIQNNQVNWTNVPYTSYVGKNACEFELSNGDILFARTGATVGKSYLVENLQVESLYASYLIRVRVSANYPTKTNMQEITH